MRCQTSATATGGLAAEPSQLSGVTKEDASSVVNQTPYAHDGTKDPLVSAGHGENVPVQQGSEPVSPDKTVDGQGPRFHPEYNHVLGRHFNQTVTMVALRRAPDIYEPLVAILEKERLRGRTRITPSILGALLLLHHEGIFARAGCKSLGQYIQRAKDAGVVLTEPLSDSTFDVANPWVALHPRYHGKAPKLAE